MERNIFIEQIKLIKTKLNNNEMSVLVGAGFSKNVSNIFPSWTQLLFDLVFFLFEDEITELYKIKKKEDKSLNKKEFYEQRVHYYMNKSGYLNLVSDYIKRFGYREIITTYIEARIPKLDKNREYLLYTLKGKDNKIKITEKMLSQHKMLINLPWNNIYTTNYDEMLEFANSFTAIGNIDDEIKNIEDKINEYNIELSEIENKIKEIGEKKELLKEKIKLLNSNKPYDDLKSNEIKKKEVEIIKVERKLNSQKEVILTKVKDKEEERNQLDKARNQQFSLVTQSSQLSLKRNKNIIKLHGSLRKDNSSFGFDGDIKKQYIIAKEDYETYPKKHEAFTQLMRISLLQESYCLIGFSGTDPNFLEWIKWVRDVLDKHKKTNEYKIYLIDVNNEKLTQDKSLFFENHHIFRIPLITEEVVAFLERETNIKIKNKKDKKEVLKLLLLYLSNNSIFNLSQVIFELLKTNKYNDLWNRIDLGKPTLENLDEVIALKKYNPFPPLIFPYTSNKNRLLFFVNKWLNDTESKTPRENLLSLTIIALKDTLLIPSFAWKREDEKNFSNKIKSSLFYDDFLIVRLRQSVLTLNSRMYNKINKMVLQKEKFHDDMMYNSILYSAFSLNFKDLKIKLENWNPCSPDWILKKIGLLAFFDKEKSLEIVINNHINLSNVNTQYQLISLHLWRHLKLSVDFQRDKNVDNEIKKYKNAGLKDVSDNLDSLIDDIKNNEEKIRPYGKDKFSISKGFSFSNDFTREQKALQFIQILIESGYPLSLNGVYLKKHSEWYNVFKILYEYLPYPTLFYSLQYSDKDFLKRVGQDFAYSEKLKKDLPRILKLLLEAYLTHETPYYIKENVLAVTSELIIAVSPQKWETFFRKLLNSKSFVKKAFSNLSSVENDFLISAIKHTKNTQIIKKILFLALDSNTKNNTSIYISYYLNNNYILKKEKANIQTKKISNFIKKIIKSINEINNNIFIVSNLDIILTDLQKAEIKKQIKKIDFSKITNAKIWTAILFYIYDDKSTVKKIKKAILNSEQLWENGISENNLSLSNNFIEISRLQKTKNRPFGLLWNKSEITRIFNKLKESFSKIEKFANNPLDFYFIEILYEMFLFLTSSSQILKSHSDYEQTYRKVKELYFQHRGYNSLKDGLLSKDKPKVVWALHELFSDVYSNNSLNNYMSEIDIIINKILLQSEPALEACTKYLAELMTERNNKNIFLRYKETIVLLLRKYDENRVENIDKPYLYSQLIRIAEVLSDWKCNDNYVLKWLKKKEEIIYKNILEEY